MKRFKIQYKDGKSIIVEATTAIEVIKEYDLCTRENISTKLTETFESVTVL